MPTYEPLVRCERYSVLAWVAHEDDEDPCQRRLRLGLALTLTLTLTLTLSQA